MLRTAALRSLAQMAARPVARHAAVALRRRAAVASAAVPRVQIAPRAAAWTAVRCYASGGGLKKEEVEGRIMALLQGFDKVRSNPNNLGTDVSLYLLPRFRSLLGREVAEAGIEFGHCRDPRGLVGGTNEEGQITNFFSLAKQVNDPSNVRGYFALLTVSKEGKRLV